MPTQLRTFVIEVDENDKYILLAKVNDEYKVFTRAKVLKKLIDELNEDYKQVSTNIEKQKNYQLNSIYYIIIN